MKLSLFILILLCCEFHSNNLIAQSESFDIEAEMWKANANYYDIIQDGL